MFEGWTPEQRKIAMYGAPLVGAVVVGMKLRSNSAKAAAAAAAVKPAVAAGAIPTIAAPSTNVVGIDQLAEYENAVTGVLDHIASAVDNLQISAPPPPATTPPPTIVPTPPVPTPVPTPTPQPPVATPPPDAPTPPAQRTYVVRSGDTLSGIALSNYGSASRWPDIYNANVGTIEAAARAHGRSSSSQGHWIYPGTELVLP